MKCRLVAALILVHCTTSMLAAQQPGARQVAIRVASCSAFVGSTALAADILVDHEWSGWLGGIALAFLAGETSRPCLYGPGARPTRLLGQICDNAATEFPILGMASYAALDGDLNDEAGTALAMGAFGLLGGVIKERICPDLGGPRIPPVVEQQRWETDR